MATAPLKSALLELARYLQLQRIVATATCTQRQRGHGWSIHHVAKRGLAGLPAPLAARVFWCFDDEGCLRAVGGTLGD